MLTVKELADKLNVSKQTINNNVPVYMKYEKVNNVNYIDEQLEKAITDNINKNKNRFSSSSYEDTKENTSSDEQLNNVINVLIQQLNSKDEQIERLHNQLDKQNQSLINEQTINRQYQLDNNQSDNSNHNESDEADYKEDTSTQSDKKDINNSYTHEDEADISNTSNHHKKKSLLSRIFNK